MFLYTGWWLIPKIAVAMYISDSWTATPCLQDPITEGTSKSKSGFHAGALDDCLRKRKFQFDVALPFFRHEQVLIRMALLVSLYSIFKEAYFLGIFGVLRYIYNIPQLLFWNLNRQFSQKAFRLKNIQYLTGNFSTGITRTHE